MAELLLKVDPACLTANEQAGQVVVVMPDGHAWSELERKLFVVVRVPLSVEEAEAKYLKDGIPDEMKKADAEAVDALLALDENTDPVTRQEVEATARATGYKKADYPSRAEYFDMSLVPQKAVDVVLATRQILTDNQPAIKAAARSAVEAKHLELTGEPALADLTTRQMYENAQRTSLTEIIDERVKKGELTGLQATQLKMAHVDDFGTALLEASKYGADAVEKPLLASITPHPIIEL